MPPMSAAKYKALLEDDEAGLFSDVETLTPLSKPTTYKLVLLAVSAVVLTALNTSLWLFSNSPSRPCSQSLGPEIWSPASSSPQLLTHSPKHINGNINQQNVYRGFPSPEIDQAWEHIGLEAPGIRVPSSEVSRLNKTTENLHLLPQRDGAAEEEYLGMVEVFHLLHCLDSLRSTAYRDLYREEVEFHPIQQMDAYRIHLDHCVDMLRENLMCTSDLSVVLFEYDDHHKLPQPDFSMTKKCRNFEAILEWNHKTDKRVEWDMLDIRRSQEGDDH